MSEDPIGFDEGENFYIYCFDNPVNFIDPTGLKVEVCYSYIKYTFTKGVHAFVRTSKGSYGFGPKPGWQLSSLGGGDVPGRISSDNNTPFRCTNMTQDDCKDDCIAKAVQKARKMWQWKYYNIDEHNCNDFVDYLLSQCGI